jgi:hypothetical protein
MEELRKNFNIDLIKETINEINKELIKMKNIGENNIFNLEMNIAEMFPEFYDEYPFLVKKICKGDDIETLYKMLQCLNQVEKGKKSLCEVEKKLGNELLNKYIPKK